FSHRKSGACCAAAVVASASDSAVMRCRVMSCSLSSGAAAPNVDFAAKRLGRDACRAAANLEREALGGARSYSVFAWPQRDRKLAVDLAAPRLDGELRICIARNRETNVSGVRGEVVAPRRIDGAVVRHVGAIRPGAHGP